MTNVTIDTSSTDAIYAGIIARLLDAPIPVSSPLHALATTLRPLFTPGDSTQPRLYQVQAPNGVAFPYALLRVDTQSGTYQQRLTAQLEIQVFHKPRAQQALLDRIADHLQLALTQVSATHPNGGGLTTRTMARMTMPAAGPPADREIVGVRLLVSCTIWPQFLATLIP